MIPNWPEKRNTLLKSKEAKLFKNLQLSWLLKMAWRDSRRSRSRLLLFISSIIAGIAVLVAIYSLSDNLGKNIDSQAAGLLGADLEVSANRAFTSSAQTLLDSIGTTHSDEQSFASMIVFT